MATSGQSIENPVTGERITWLQTAADSDGETLAFDIDLRPGAAVSAQHRHLRQTEEFSVLEGTLMISVAGRRDEVQPGDQFTVQPGTAHQWWNASASNVRVRVTLRPALDTETFFETLFGLARDGKTNKKGIPSLPQIAVAYRDLGASCSRVTRPPVVIQDAVFALIAPLGRLLGKRAAYARYSPGHPKA